MLVPLLLFAIGLVFLVKGADLFVDGGRDLAARYGLSASTIGFTIIAFGTSLPELSVTMNAVASGSTDVGLGNVLGSNIANLGLILSLVVILRPKLMNIHLSRDMLMNETLLMLIATGLYTALALRGVIDLLSGIVFLVAFGLMVRKMGSSNKEMPVPRSPSAFRDWSFIAMGLIGVIFGSFVLLKGAVDLAVSLGIPAYVIGLSMVAVGTSIPEFATSVVAIMKGEVGISVGNMLGSNIFNLLFILGCSSFVAPIPVPGLRDTLLVVLFAVMIIPLFLLPERQTRWWAVLIFTGYCGYIVAIYSFV
ncbi:MAG: sodium:calcium antiporter [Methanomicrobiales archaeon]|nr:sodium:calcium antiporter [Methanomicrobiales archaeon]